MPSTNPRRGHRPPACARRLAGALPPAAARMIAALLLLAATASAQRGGGRLLFSMYDTPQPTPREARLQPLYRGVALSSDGGASWSACAWPTNRNNDVAVDPRDPSVLYVAGDYGVLRSTDGGGRWKQITPQGAAAALRILPADDALWLATAGGVYRSTDGGESWSPRSDGLPPLDGTYVSDLAVDGTALLAATGAGLFRCSDRRLTYRGRFWRQEGFAGMPLSRLAVRPEGSYALTAEQGLFRAAPGTDGWTCLTDSLRGHTFLAMAFHPAEPTILLGTGDAGVLRSTDGGATWSNSSGGLQNMHVTALAFSRGDPSSVYAGTENGSFVSRDGGATWQAFTVRIGYISAIIAE